MDSDLVSLRSKCQHFRILVIGRANAGKTTLLKKVCHSIENPEIFDPEGKPIDAKDVEGSIGRGLHDIDKQLIFKSNPQYIFHDSLGFESGSIEETNKVKTFIAKRANSNALSEQLHAIWYCLTTATNRPLLTADEDFFGTNVTGKVPVIAILTKCDAVVSQVFQNLLDEGTDPNATLVDQKAQEMLDTRFVDRLRSMEYPPDDYVQVQDMHEDGDCKQLITKTAGALTDDVLRLLFVSVQRNNINLCIRHAVEQNITMDDWLSQSVSRGSALSMVRKTLAWFPHIWLEENYDTEEQWKWSMKAEELGSAIIIPEIFRTNIATAMAIMNPKSSHMTQNPWTRKEVAEVTAALCICAEQTFGQGFARMEAFPAAFSRAFNVYLTSTNKSQVESAIATLPLQDHEQVKNSDVALRLVDIITTHRLRIPMLGA